MTLAQGDEILPPKNLEVSGIPRVPAALVKGTKPYLGAYGLPLAGWHPEKRELWVKGISSAAWVARLDAPISQQKTWVYLPFSDVYDLYFQPQSKYLIYNRDTNGDESFQLFLYNLATRSTTLLSDGKSRNTEPIWSHSGEQVVWSYSPSKGSGVGLSVINPFQLETRRLLVASTGNYLKAYDWTPDDAQVVFCEYSGAATSKLWLIDVAKGEKRLLSGAKTIEYYDAPQVSKDGKGMFVITNRGTDVRHLSYLNLASGQYSNLTDEIRWDIDEFQLAPDGKTLAFIANENGLSHLYLLDTKSSIYKPVNELPSGLISDLKWHNNSTDLAFNFKSPRTPNDVYSLNVKTSKVDLWAKSISGELALDTLPLPEVIQWKSFDDKTISGFLYRPSNKFSGKRPVIIEIHGGPEEQYRPIFGYEDNYFINELGIVKIYPNVRGSTGYGKKFLDLDNGIRREDAVKDIGALLDWIKKQPNLDADRVLIHGESYGGYMALSVAANYGDRITGTISEAGATNLATFIEHTEGWRRELRRLEFGDERDPKVKAFMERTAPLNNVRKIKKPLLIMQGRNDPRVPVSEAEAMIAAAKQQGTPVWSLIASDEGHTFVKQANRDFRLYAIILFVQEYLLRQANNQPAPFLQRPKLEK